MLRNVYASFLALALTACATTAPTFVKTAAIPHDADEATILDIASRVVPDERQLQWQDLEMTAFLHFGVNTFTDREWGEGTENPAVFNPTNLDADQWVRTLRDAGFKLVILTAKHHDGFCLWPSALTNHSVAASPWRDGKGDVVRELREACDRYGMKLGIYLSPWDRNAPTYGDSPAYNDYFVGQLTELLSNYGKVDEVWFDGACGEGPNGKKQVYDWLRFRETIKKHQPDAVLAITGDDVRWVGNEGGVGRETEWSVTPLTPKIYADADSLNSALGLNEMSSDLGSRDLIKRASALHWWPSEVDVSIRPGWFFHASEQPHSLARLANIYLKSVGRNSVLLMNIPPDTQGRIHPVDSLRLMEFRRWIDNNFAQSLTSDAPAMKVGLDAPTTVNTVVLGEDIRKGQHVESLLVQVRSNGEWVDVDTATTVGKKRILVFDDIEADSLRLKVLSSRGEPYVSILGVHRISMPVEVAQEKSPYPVVSSPEWSWTALTAPTPMHIVDMQSPTTIAGLTYTPSTEQGAPLIYHYNVEVSTDGRTWTPVVTNGEFSNVTANPIAQHVIFPKPIAPRFVRLTAVETTQPDYSPVVGEIVILAPPVMD